MKKRMLPVILICLCLMAFASVRLAGAGGETLRQDEAAALPDPSSVATLPPSLVFIGEGAFEGTGLENVYLPSSLEVIEDRAFADIAPLERVYIPEETKSIGDSAFENDSHVVIMGESGSYAEGWAREHGLQFVVYCDPAVQVGSSGSEERQKGAQVSCLFASALLWLLAALNKRKPILWGMGEGKTMRPQDRPELNPIDYSFP